MIKAIAIKQIIDRGKTHEVGAELSLDDEQYERLRRDGAVLTAKEHDTLEQARADIEEFEAASKRSADEERARVEAAAQALTEAEANAALDDDDVDENGVTLDDAAKEARKLRRAAPKPKRHR